MSGTKYGSNYRGSFHPPMTDDERVYAFVDYDQATTDEQKLGWLAKWGDRIRDNMRELTL
jgi:hypothetical protein